MAAVRRRVVTDPVPRPDALSPAAARRRRAVMARSATLDPAEPGRRALMVLLPSADAATILVLCEAAAELTS